MHSGSACYKIHSSVLRNQHSGACGFDFLRTEVILSSLIVLQPCRSWTFWMHWIYLRDTARKLYLALLFFFLGFLASCRPVSRPSSFTFSFLFCSSFLVCFFLYIFLEGGFVIELSCLNCSKVRSVGDTGIAHGNGPFLFVILSFLDGSDDRRWPE